MSAAFQLASPNWQALPASGWPSVVFPVSFSGLPPVPFCPVLKEPY